MPNNNEIFGYNAGPPIVWGWGNGGFPGWYNNPFYYNQNVYMSAPSDEQQTRMHWKYAEDLNDHKKQGIKDQIELIDLRDQLKHARNKYKEPPVPHGPAEPKAAFSELKPDDMVEKFFEKNLRSYQDPMTKEVIHPKLVTSVLAAKGRNHEDSLRQKNGEVFRVLRNYEEGYNALLKKGMPRDQAAIEVMNHLEQNRARGGHEFLVAAMGRDDPGDRTKLKGSFGELMSYNTWINSSEGRYSGAGQLQSSDSRDSRRNYQPDNTRNYDPTSVVTTEDTRQAAINRAFATIDRNVKLIDETQMLRDKIGYRSQGVDGQLVKDWMLQLKRDMQDGVIRNHTDYNTPHDRKYGGKREEYAPPVNDIVLKSNPEVEYRYRNLEAILRGGGTKAGQNGEKVDAALANEITFLANKFTSLVPGVDTHKVAEVSAPNKLPTNTQANFVPRTPPRRS